MSLAIDPLAIAAPDGWWLSIAFHPVDDDGGWSLDIDSMTLPIAGWTAQGLPCIPGGRGYGHLVAWTDNPSDTPECASMVWHDRPVCPHDECPHDVWIERGKNFEQMCRDSLANKDLAAEISSFGVTQQP